MKRINFHVTREETILIYKIIDRAQLLAKHGIDRMSAGMDLSACQNSCPLDLQGMLDADDFNFAHDFFGIKRHMDRTTGELGDCFLPRFARPRRERIA